MRASFLLLLPAVAVAQDSFSTQATGIFANLPDAQVVTQSVGGMPNDPGEDLSQLLITGWHSDCNDAFQCQGDYRPNNGTLAPIDVTGNTCYVNPAKATKDAVIWFSKLPFAGGTPLEDQVFAWAITLHAPAAGSVMPVNCDADGACECGAFEAVRAGWDSIASSSDYDALCKWPATTCNYFRTRLYTAGDCNTNFWVEVTTGGVSSRTCVTAVSLASAPTTTPQTAPPTTPLPPTLAPQPQPTTAPAPTTVPAPTPVPNNPPCDLCVDGSYPGATGVTLETSFGNFTCQEMAVAGLSGIVPASSCRLIQSSFAPFCACDEPWPTPTASPAPNALACPICDEVLTPTYPDKSFLLYGNYTFTCLQLQNGDGDSLINPADCNLVQNLIKSFCGCDPNAPTPSPTVLAPTPQPSKPQLTFYYTTSAPTDSVRMLAESQALDDKEQLEEILQDQLVETTADLQEVDSSDSASALTAFGCATTFMAMAFFHYFN